VRVDPAAQAAIQSRYLDTESERRSVEVTLGVAHRAQVERTPSALVQRLVGSGIYCTALDLFVGVELDQVADLPLIAGFSAFSVRSST
jgi:hypothetical protein